MALLSKEIDLILAQVQRLASADGKSSGFCIGNTRKIDEAGLYFSPIRSSRNVVAGSAIVYNVDQAVSVAQAVDGLVDYVLVDAEKKIGQEMYGADNIGNVERAVRETVKKSKLLTYKGNDLTVDSIEYLIVHILSTYPRGLGGKKASIIGAGNIGSKLAIKLVERGMDVALFRRNSDKLKKIVTALNIIKPAETTANVYGAPDALSASAGSHLLVGLTQGTPVITPEMVDALAPGAVIIDGGKGCCEASAIDLARALNITIYRADIRPGFEGHTSMMFETERIMTSSLGRAQFNGVPVVASGLLAHMDEVVVDSISEPHVAFGVANGQGDFVRSMTPRQALLLQTVSDYIDGNRRHRQRESCGP